MYCGFPYNGGYGVEGLDQVFNRYGVDIVIFYSLCPKALATNEPQMSWLLGFGKMKEIF
jgi:hypothetical protein